jgi:hypothetical protein
MNSFETVKNTLLSLSKSKRDYDLAVSEWDYFGDFHDNEVGNGTCQLCGQPNIRYEFQIVNRNNQNTLLVGSECITKFGITVYDDYGNRITGHSAKARVMGDRRSLVASAKTQGVINALISLASKDNEFDFHKFISYYQERGAFTPNQLTLVMWRLNKFRISHEKSHFKLVMQRDREKQQLLRMEEWKLHQIKACLSGAQRGWLGRNGRAI